MLIWYSRRSWDSSVHNDNGALALHFVHNLDTSSSGSWSDMPAVAGLYSILFLDLSIILVKSSQDFWRELVLVHLVWGVPAEMVGSVSDIGS